MNTNIDSFSPYDFQAESDKFSVQFYLNAINCCSVKKPDVKPPRDLICFDDGHCIDIGDPGVHPHMIADLQ